MSSSIVETSRWYTNNCISNDIVVVQGSDLLSPFIGHSSIKTRHLLDKNLGKVILIEEAQCLILHKNDMFGFEIIGTIITFLSEYPSKIGLILSGDHDLLMDGLFKWFPKLLLFFELYEDQPKEPEGD